MCVWTAHVLWVTLQDQWSNRLGQLKPWRDPLPAQCSVSQSQLLSHREVSRSLDLLYVYLIVHL